MTTASGIGRLAVDKHGRPVPWFVHWEDGVPDFRVIGKGKLQEAVRFDLCWVCGQRRGRHAAFVIGPMCAVNRISAEPPSHLGCALYSAQHCPFLSTPTMTRRERHLPDHFDPPGQMLTRNPGVALVWSSRTWAPAPVPAQLGGGVLFDIGEPTQVSWWAHSREATRDEVLASIQSGLPALEAACQKDRNPAAAARALGEALGNAMALVPA